MKIVKKISLKRGIQRINQPNPSYPKLSRRGHYYTAPFRLTASDQLHKYGVKARFFQFKWLIAGIIGCLGGLFWKVYVAQLYTNQLDTIYRYRQMQKQGSSLILMGRKLFVDFFFFFQRNFFISALFKKQSMGKNQYEQITQGVIRYQQYQHFINNKDKRFDFLDIGLLEKYPYPKKVQPMA